jgi:hypothetical protein
MGFVAWRHELLQLMETAQPTELRLATNVIRFANEFQERAKALERAMEEAAEISKQMQLGIEAEKQQLAELRERYRQEVRLKDLTDEEVAAIRSELTQDNARARRWSLWFSLLLTLVGCAIGVLTNAMIDNRTDRTVNLTRPAAMLHGGTRRTGRVSLPTVGADSSPEGSHNQ